MDGHCPMAALCIQYEVGTPLFSLCRGSAVLCTDNKSRNSESIAGSEKFCPQLKIFICYIE